jgi:hypothetical protein
LDEAAQLAQESLALSGSRHRGQVGTTLKRIRVRERIRAQHVTRSPHSPDILPETAVITYEESHLAPRMP